MGDNIISAVFDDRAEAQRALQELRNAGIDEGAISLLGQADAASDNDTDHQEGASKASVAASAAAGGVGGAILGVAALAIPGVGPLAAAGAIAASAVGPMAAAGAALGAAGGAAARMLNDHDVEGRDAEYYGKHIERGGTFVSVDARRSHVDQEQVRNILRSCGGHSPSNPKNES
jgi:uncharacterized membrane protein